MTTMVERIERELEALDPAPFRRVLARLIDHLERTPIEGLTHEKGAKVARDYAMLIGYATPQMIVTHNHLHVEQLTDVQLLAEQRTARAALDTAMAQSLLLPPDQARSVPTNPAQSLLPPPQASSVPTPLPVPATGGVGSTGETEAYAWRDPPAEKKKEKAHAKRIEPAPGRKGRKVL